MPKRTHSSTPAPADYTTRLFRCEIPVYYLAPFHFYLPVAEVAAAIGCDADVLAKALKYGTSGDGLGAAGLYRYAVPEIPHPRAAELLTWAIEQRRRAFAGRDALHWQAYRALGAASPQLGEARTLLSGMTSQEREILLGAKYPGYVDIEPLCHELFCHWRDLPQVRAWLMTSYRDGGKGCPQLAIPPDLLARARPSTPQPPVAAETPDFISRLAELIGPAAAAQVIEEFGGRALYVPKRNQA